MDGATATVFESSCGDSRFSECQGVTISNDDKPIIATSEQEVERASPDQWVDEYADEMFRYAMLRLGDATAAEDIVQEAFLAGWKSRGSFEGKATERTWLLAILKRKIVDVHRKRSREIGLSDRPESVFNKNGTWRETIHPWIESDPSQELVSTEFWTSLRTCMARLTPSLLETFVLRDCDSHSSEDVCERLRISRSNLAIRLHRARLQLRDCLNKHWFRKAPEEKGKRP